MIDRPLSGCAWETQSTGGRVRRRAPIDPARMEGLQANAARTDRLGLPGRAFAVAKGVTSDLTEFKSSRRSMASAARTC